MSEPVAIKYNGGPLHGQAVYDMAWPPPETMPSESNGIYRKSNQSQITDEQAATLPIIRGAEYTWEPS